MAIQCYWCQLAVHFSTAHRDGCLLKSFPSVWNTYLSFILPVDHNHWKRFLPSMVHGLSPKATASWEKQSCHHKPHTFYRKIRHFARTLRIVLKGFSCEPFPVSSLPCRSEVYKAAIRNNTRQLSRTRFLWEMYYLCIINLQRPPLCFLDYKGRLLRRMNHFYCIT